MIERYRNHPQVFAFVRSFSTAVAVALLNFGQDEVTLVLEGDDLPTNVVGFAELALDNYHDLRSSEEQVREILQSSVTLRGYQGRIFVKQQIP